MDSTLTTLASRLAAALAAAAGLAAGAANHELVVSPIAPGPFNVACSNVEQNQQAIADSGALATDFWEGMVVGGRARYLTEVLTQPTSAFVFDARVPDDRRLFPIFAGDLVEHVAIVCHPTSRDNPDPDYTLPGTGRKVPHMLPRGASPRLISEVEYRSTLGMNVAGAPAGPAKLPVIVYSHGLGGSPISKGYIDILVQLAAQGYLVSAVFHADPRFSRVRLEDLGDYFYAVFFFNRIVEMQMMRPASLRSMLDALLEHPGYAPGIDTGRIGGFGASMGGQAMAHLLGARATRSLDKDCADAPTDPRVKAAVGYVPYSGQLFLPAFCDDQHGASGVDRPYLAITGSLDTTSPQVLTQQAVNRFRGSRYMISLFGGEHELRAEDIGDLFTWMVTFLNAHLEVRGDPGAMARFIKLGRVVGGRDDSVEVDVHVPTSFSSANFERPAREFYNVHNEHYFMAAGQDEVDAILAGSAGPGWELTGEITKVHTQTDPVALSAIAPVCRFYGAIPNSHFFTPDPAECELVKRPTSGWLYEGVGFYVSPAPALNRCPDGMLKVMRAYNDGFRNGKGANHRYSTSDSTMREMSRRGWIVEGTAWCARP